MTDRPSSPAPADRAATELRHGCAVCGATDLTVGDGHVDRCPGSTTITLNGLSYSLRS